MNIDKVIEALPFFKKLSNSSLEQLKRISTLKKYKNGYTLHYEKTQSDRLLFLIKGLAKAYKIDKYENEVFLYYIYPHMLISEISTLNYNYLISYSNIVLIEDAKILSINYEAFKSEFLDTGLLCLEFANEIIRQSKQLQNLVNREFIFNSVAKVAMMIDTDVEMFNKLKRSDVSLMLHIQPSTLSRVLNRLKNNGMIDIIHGKVIILNIKQLKKIYGGEDE